MITLMRFNIFLIFLCIFTYLGIQLNYYINMENTSKFKYTINICFFMSILFIISLTIFPVELSLNRIFEFNLIPFRTIIEFLSNVDIIDIFGNIIMFVPLGFFSYIQFKGKKLKSIMFCLCLTILVEIVQLILPGHLTDIDDVILNFLGGYIGILLSINFVNYISSKKAHRT